MPDCPRWLDIFIKLVRPGALALMVGLLVFGGLFFAGLELFIQGAGERAATVFVSFFRAMDDNYYTTVQVMFTVYVAGRSGQAIATSISDAKVKVANADAG